VKIGVEFAKNRGSNYKQAAIMYKTKMAKNEKKVLDIWSQDTAEFPVIKLL
jgi:hypothetical protein